MTIATTRRTFLAGAAATAALTVGFAPSGALANADAVLEANPFVRVAPDGTVTVILKHFEMGQGTTTGLATLVAEEMDADWDTLAIDWAPADNERYANLAFGGQGTGGSTAIANSYMQYRQAGAAARAMLVAAAAEAWGVPAGDITIEDGVMRAGDREAGFGDFVAAASVLEAPAEPALKSPDAFRLIGRPDLPRKDSAAKTDGSAIFAIDVDLPDQVFAVILRSPRFGGTLARFDAAGAAERPGFIDAKPLANGAGVAVYATSTWEAIAARDLITAEWDFSGAESRSTAAMEAAHRDLLDSPTYETRPGADRAATEAALAGAAQVVEGAFLFPHLAHAPMEPLNCVIEATETGVRVHDGCQFPAITQPTVAGILGLELGQVEIRTVYAGGSFGRRANPTSDYHAEAALAFQALGGERPVKLVWTREDDIRGGYYRPMAAHRARIGLDAEGRVVAWDHRIAVKSILKGTLFEGFLVKDGVDATSVEGIADAHYAIPAMSVGLADAESGVPVLWWRAVGHTHTAFAMESLMDMAAEAAGTDPVAFRLALLEADGGPDDADRARLAGALRLAADKAGWDTPLPGGRGRGVAVHKSFGSYVALVAEVSTVDGAVRIERVTCAVDCGTVVNPDIVRAQMEGGIGFGLGAVMRNEVTLTDGEVDQANFPDYEPLRITEMPAIDVHIVPSTAAPTGVGEPGTPPSGPALANAVRAATGTRVTELPMTRAGITFA